jgi:hypothetical protein
MAGKKPAKKNITNTPEKKKELPGKAVMYYGSKTALFTCPTCNKSMVKGILWEHNSQSYCTRSCIPKPELEPVV